MTTPDGRDRKARGGRKGGSADQGAPTELVGSGGEAAPTRLDGSDAATQIEAVASDGGATELIGPEAGARTEIADPATGKTDRGPGLAATVVDRPSAGRPSDSFAAPGGRADGIVIGRALAASAALAVILLVAAATAWGSVSAQQLARAETVISGLRSAAPIVGPPGATQAPTASPGIGSSPPIGSGDADIQARIDAAVAAERTRIASACVTPMTAAAAAQDSLLKKYDRVAAVYRPGSAWDKVAASQVSKLDLAYRQMFSAAKLYRIAIGQAVSGSLAFHGIPASSYESAQSTHSAAGTAGIDAAKDEAKITAADWKALTLKAQTTQLTAATTACQAALAPSASAAP